jgi:hypothetical protein
MFVFSLSLPPLKPRGTRVRLVFHFILMYLPRHFLCSSSQAKGLHMKVILVDKLLIRHLVACSGASRSTMPQYRNRFKGLSDFQMCRKPCFPCTILVQCSLCITLLGFNSDPSAHSFVALIMTKTVSTLHHALLPALQRCLPAVCQFPG